MTSSPIAFIDLKAQGEHLGNAIPDAINRVLQHGAFIMGPEVKELEKQLAAFCGAKHCITCANGTDALQLVLMAEGVGPGDAIFVPSFTFVATGEVVPSTGATPFFVDVTPDTFTMDVSSLEATVALARKMGLRPRMVIPVDLFGQPANYDDVNDIAEKEGMTVMADAAQAFGATWRGRKVGTLASWTTTSFFPAKPLGCYGDGGAIFTDDDDKASLLRSLRIHGKGADKYDNVRIGVNSRLDTIQAAILLEKLKIFPDEIASRQRAADRYNEKLSAVAKVPFVPKESQSVWAQYTLVVENRDKIAAACKAAGVPTAIHYPIPMHKQTGYIQYPKAPNGLPIAEKLASSVISLPMHPYLDQATQDRIMVPFLT